MSLTLPEAPLILSPDEPPYRLSVDQYHRMIQAGVFTSDDRLELLEGLLIRKMSKNPPHTAAQAKLVRALSLLLPPTLSLRAQDPITLSDGEPEPDIAIVQSTADDYAAHHPGAADIVLLIEIADTTLFRDRGTKLRSYARAGIREYWILNLPDRTMEVYTQPHLDQATFASTLRYTPADQVPVTFTGGIHDNISMSEVLPLH